MRGELLHWARVRDGVFTRAEALQRFAVHVLDDAVQDGVVVRMLPSTYALPHLADDRGARRRAALAYRPDAALMELDALDVWELLTAPVATGPVHLVTDETQLRSKVPDLQVTRRNGFRNEPPDVAVRKGMRVTRLERTIVDSWPEIPAIDRRLPALIAVRERRTTGARLLDALELGGRVKGAAEMRHVFGLIAAGCHSELELWGHKRVFNVGELRRAKPQFRLETRIGVVYLDRFYEEELVAVELDGAAYHGSPGQRERDIRRDAVVAGFGIQTIRFSHPRLFHHERDVRRETLDVLAARRRQLGVRPA